MKLKKMIYIIVGCIGLALGAVWVFHILFFVFGVKTIKKADR